MVAMLAPGNVGRKVRKYYIWLESALKTYLREQMNARSQRILELEAHLKAKDTLARLAGDGANWDGLMTC